MRHTPTYYMRQFSYAHYELCLSVAEKNINFVPEHVNSTQMCVGTAEPFLT